MPRTDRLEDKNEEVIGSTSEPDQTASMVQKGGDRYRDLFQRLPVGLYRTTPDGRILDANQALVSLLGFPDRETLLRVNASDLFLEREDRRQQEVILQQVDVLSQFDTRLRRYDGQVIWVRDTARAIRDDAGNILYYEGVLEDITARKQAEEEVHRLLIAEREQRELAEILVQVSEAMNSNLEFYSLLDSLLDLAGRLVPYDRGEMFLVEQGVARLVSTRGYDDLAPHLRMQIHNVALETGQFENLRWMVEHRRPLIIPDIDHYPGWIWVTEVDRGVHSYLGAPVVAKSEVIALLILRKVEPDYFTLGHLRRMQAFVNQAALALQNARLYAQTVEDLKREQSLNQVAQILSSSMDLPDVLRNVVRLAVELTGAQGGNLALLTQDGARLTYPYSYHFPPHPMEETVHGGKGVSFEVLASGQPLLIRNYAAHHLAFSDFVQAGVQEMICAPISAGEARLGVLGLIRYLKEHHFTERDLALAESVGRQAGLAIQKARLYQDMKLLASTDPLTGVYNRRHFFDVANREFERSRRYRLDFSVIIFDLDSFKQVNDTYGHISGDQALKSIASICQNNLRQVDILARYGGEEFVVLLPEIPLEGAGQVAERLRKLIAGEEILCEGGQPIHLTASFGAAALQSGTLSLDEILTGADQALLVAKQRGKNQVYLWGAGSEMRNQPLK